MNTHQAIYECKKILQAHYGNRLRGVMLYGSLAREQSAPDSDIDLLVLLNKPLDYLLELRQIIDLLYPIQLESERLISAKPVALDDFEQGRIALYRNAKREGVAV